MRKNRPASRIARRDEDAMRTGRNGMRSEGTARARASRTARREAGRLDEGVVEFVVIVDACCACRAPFVDGFFVVDACRDVVPVCF